MNLKSGTIDQFEGYSNFSSLQEFNRHMEMWMLQYKDDFSKGELVGLKRLVRYSAKIPGVCNAKIGTMLKSIHEEYNGNGVSRSTFKRMIQKAVALGIFTVYETERKNGSQSSNLYVFNRYPEMTSTHHEPPETEILNHPNETSNPLKTKQNIKERKDAPLDFTFTSDRVPVSFVEAIKPFFPESKIIEEYWKMTIIAASKHNRDGECIDMIELSIKAFKQMLIKLKRNTVHNPFSYFYGVLTRKLEVLYDQELEEEEEYFAESISMQRKEASKKSELFSLLQEVLPLA
ncbi:hypothetical protein RGU12_10040 [Fredinandcohnia sp. QZ13]|uniref:hypothetical protein n=1 Tax=Fredinandcohnia sp. QZ13 TaxID=3073144 RepID=UPI00285327A0|nr:hypothetical protein [Fredinandcohnia sp. QZ13]MDR4887887.1 hypothetical protein [Fredinandcohnia sp. QZ13]